MVNDFIVRYNPATESKSDLANKIIYDMFYNRRIKQNKPCKMGIFGKSGEGKSLTALRIQEQLLQAKGLTLQPIVKDINVFVPLEYPTKIKNLLGLNDGGFQDTGLKKAFLVCVHEARELVKAKYWQSFVNTAIADVNEMSRAVKRLIFMIVSQSIRDISSDIRGTLDFYIKCYRPHKQRTRLYIYSLWVDERDMDKIKLRKRKVSGVLIYPNGQWRRYAPQYFEISIPNRDIIKIFDEEDFKSKSKIIRSKLNRLMKDMALEANVENDKLESLIDFHVKNPDALNTIGKIRAGKWIVKKEAAQLYDLTKQELKEFETKIQIKLGEKTKEVVEND